MNDSYTAALLLAIKSHAEAITAWTATIQGSMTIEAQVEKVEQAVAASGTAYRNDFTMAPDQRDQLNAALRDREAGHAIRVHTLALQVLTASL